jgi:UDP-glucose 4-epimerase
MKYVVTGGAGFIGSHIAEELLRARHEVVIFDNLSSGTMANIAPLLSRKDITFVSGSILDLPQLKETFRNADGIFHEAAIVSVPRSVADPAETHEVNLSGTLNVLIAARDCGVKKVLSASSAAVYGDDPVLPKCESMMPASLSPYAVSKHASEEYCSVFSRLYGVRCTSLRYFNVFGSRQDPTSPYSGVITKFITGILAHRPIVIYGDGRQTRDFVYVKDVVQANIRAMDRGTPGVFNIACGRSIDLNGLATMIMELTGISVPVTFELPRAGDIMDSLADISRARQAFGYAPEYSLRTGLEETINWFQEQ